MARTINYLVKWQWQYVNFTRRPHWAGFS